MVKLDVTPPRTHFPALHGPLQLRYLSVRLPKHGQQLLAVPLHPLEVLILGGCTVLPCCCICCCLGALHRELLELLMLRSCTPL